MEEENMDRGGFERFVREHPNVKPEDIDRDVWLDVHKGMSARRRERTPRTEKRPP